jgi:transporter family-2 protein
VSAGNALAVALSIAAGLAGAVQAAVMGRLGARIGTVEALAYSTLVSFVVGMAVLLVVRRSIDGIAAGVREPVWLWSGGLLSAFIVLALTVAAPRVGVTATIGLLIAGNLAMGTLIDRYGLLGSERIPLDWPRLVGIVLLATGAVLALRK